MVKTTMILMTLCSAFIQKAFGQGEVLFMNKNPFVYPPIDAPISYEGGGPAPAGRIDGATAISSDGYVWGGINARAGLYAGAAGTPEDQLIFLAPAVGFLSTGTNRAGYILGDSRVVPNVYYFESGIFQVRAWDAGIPSVGSYEDAVAISLTRNVYLGMSQPITLELWGPSAPGTPLIGLQPFSIAFVPEPSMLALGAAGAIGALLVFCRRR